MNSTTLSSYGWKTKKTKKETPTLVWEIIRTAVPYTNIAKQCSLCLHEKLAILMYPNHSEHLKKRYELVSKCRHENKYLLQTFSSNVLKSIKINVFILEHKNILVKENIYLPDDRKNVKLEVVNAKECKGFYSDDYIYIGDSQR